jgi:hypothetical protein
MRNFGIALTICVAVVGALSSMSFAQSVASPIPEQVPGAIPTDPLQNLDWQTAYAVRAAPSCGFTVDPTRLSEAALAATTTPRAILETRDETNPELIPPGAGAAPDQALPEPEPAPAPPPQPSCDDLYRAFGPNGVVFANLLHRP